MTQKKVTIKEIAERAGVSKGTVSAVLNVQHRGNTRVSAGTHQAILEAARVLNYQPNAAARALVTGRTQLIALWIPIAYRPVFNHVIEHVISRAKKDHYKVVVAQMYGFGGEDPGSPDAPLEWQVDGVIAHDAATFINRKVAEGIDLPPLVNIGPHYSEQTDYVGLDFYGGSLQAMRHLVAIGCRRIGFVGHAFLNVAGDPSYDAYVSVMREAGLNPEFVELTITFGEERFGARTTIQEYATEFGCPDGLFCRNDESAIGINWGVREMKLRVPEDVAVLGLDGIRELESHSPALSTVAQPFEEMCAMAWDFLLRRMENPALPRQCAVLPMRLIQRESTGR